MHLCKDNQTKPYKATSIWTPVTQAAALTVAVSL